jgi:hypothetical protein
MSPLGRFLPLTEDFWASASEKNLRFDKNVSRGGIELAPGLPAQYKKLTAL